MTAAIVITLSLAASTMLSDQVTFTVVDSGGAVLRTADIVVADNANMKPAAPKVKNPDGTFTVTGVKGYRDIWIQVHVTLPSGALDVLVIKREPEPGEWPPAKLEVTYYPSDSSALRVPAKALGPGHGYMLAYVVQRVDRRRGGTLSRPHWIEARLPGVSWAASAKPALVAYTAYTTEYGPCFQAAVYPPVYSYSAACECSP